MTLVRWDPLRDLLNLQEQVCRFGARSSDEPLIKKRTCWFPAVDVLETNDAYILRAELPGVGRENINIEIAGRRLIISGRRVETAKVDYAAYHTIERVEGYFERSFNIPGPIDVEQAKARYVDGILDLYLPKSEEEPDRCVKIECRD